MSQDNGWSDSDTQIFSIRTVTRSVAYHQAQDLFFLLFNTIEIIFENTL